MEEVLPASPASFSSANYDSDGVNTSSAKIFFGQFQTPEKKLATLVDSNASLVQQNSLNANTPGSSSLRRSPRLSESPARRDSEELVGEQSEQEEEDEDEPSGAFPDIRGSDVRQGSWQDAPFLEFLRPDEPSSAIASRIMRAHDNPSPPPKALRLSLSSRSSSIKVPEDVLPSIPSSSENSDAAVESILGPSDDFRTSPTPPPIVSEMPLLPTPTIFGSNSRSPTPRRGKQSSPLLPVQSDSDLISFDHSMLISHSPVGVEIHSPSPQHPQQLTIDDLLFSSPPQYSSPNRKQGTPEQEGSPTITLGRAVPPNQQFGSCTSNSEESAPFLVAPICEMGEHGDEVPKDESGVSCTPNRKIPPSVDSKNQTTPVTNLSVPASNSTLRRSPRLSTIPPPSLLTTPCRSTPVRTPTVKSSKTDGSQARKRRRESPEKTVRPSLTPKRRDWIGESDESGSEAEPFQSPSKKGKRDRKRIKKGAEISSDVAESRLAESLSPGSALILSNLVSSEIPASTSQMTVDMVPLCTPGRQESRISVEDSDPASPAKPSTPLPSGNVQRPPPGIFAPNIHTPSRGNPTRPYLAPASPVKMTLLPASRDDPKRTPARRIPIKDTDDAVNRPDGSRAPPAIRPPVFSRSALSRPPTNFMDHSPAKRKPPLELTRKVFDSIARDSQGTTSKYSEAVITGPPESVGFIDGHKPGTKTSGSVRPEQPDLSANRASAAAKGSTASQITKPVQKAESRIPRPGMLAKPTATQKSKLPMPSARRPTGLAPAPFRLPSSQKAPLTKVVQLHSNSSSSSDDSGASLSSGTSAAPTRKALAGALAKRNRAGEKPAHPQLSIKGRRVIPGMYGGPVKNIALNGAEKPPQEHQPEVNIGQTIRQHQTLRPRRVTKGTLQDFELKGPLANVESSSSEAPPAEEKLDQEIQKEPSPPVPSLEAFTFECPAPNVADEQQEGNMEMDPPMTVTTPSTTPSDPLPPSDDTTDAEMTSAPDQAPESESGTRRSSRARRPASTDVFGRRSNANLTGQRPSARRARGGPPRARGPPNLLFSTNNLALKTLTNNNTTRNQNYHAQLEMFIVRKPGARPESPTMKLRTIQEKQKEDQGKMREVRARRRRGESDVSEDMGGRDDAPPLRHRRGPGEEEDYESPVRPNDGRKAVKWDRGLEVSIFLDEIEVHPRKYRAKEGISKPRKSCLIATPNQRPLDDLGNPLNVDAPLNIVPEKVVVTKFVYDNDEEAALFDPPAPKLTRSKAKKK